MKKFVKPELTVIEFESEDVLAYPSTTVCNAVAEAEGSDMPCDGNIFADCPFFDPFAAFH